MDANKRDKLVGVGYKVFNTCGLCRFAQFSSPSVLFGTCSCHNYEHLKHTEDKSPLSITRYGTCPWFEQNDGVIVQIHAYDEFRR